LRIRNGSVGVRADVEQKTSSSGDHVHQMMSGSGDSDAGLRHAEELIRSARAEEAG